MLDSFERQGLSVICPKMQLHHFANLWRGAALLSLLLSTLARPAPPLAAATLSAEHAPAHPPALAPAGTRAHVPAAMGQLRPAFIENRGQFDPAVRFQLGSGERRVALAEDAIWVTLAEPNPIAPGAGYHQSEQASPVVGEPAGALRRLTLKLSFVGAKSHPRLEPMERLETHVSYFIGADPANWRTEVPAWGGVRYVDLYPGIDLEVSGQGGTWGWRLLRAGLGAALDRVRLRVEGADELRLDGGQLRVSTGLGEFGLPLLELDGGASAERRPVLQSDTVLTPLAGAGAPPTGQPIPAADKPGDRLYATFLGGSSWDFGSGIAVDGGGSAYVTGSTESSDFPAGPGYDTSYNGGDVDAFVVKLNASGTGLVYATFLGGSSPDRGSGIAVDASGSAYITGDTGSPAISRRCRATTRV
jgi:hypothetical protein